ncbi:VOC family protein [Rhizorhapis sp. SPR117]|uniref:VOC family protein n=1 Tax=Rhizorhapis sp. SPR117 TaxID=2912611 RepID=UPI001F343F3F|nr:VOC family protein [Rhizorhapis sp. SPR117]
MARLHYVELPSGNIGASKNFYADAFGWTFTDFGPSYAATTTGDTDVGISGDPAEATARLLPVIQVDNIEHQRAAVIKAGGQISRDIFTFPGGRRFHFTDPDGHELGVTQLDRE